MSGCTKLKGKGKTQESCKYSVAFSRLEQSIPPRKSVDEGGLSCNVCESRIGDEHRLEPPPSGDSSLSLGEDR